MSTHPKPVFGLSNKRIGTVVFLDDGTILQGTDDGWREVAPLPRTARAKTWIAEAAK